MFVGAQIGHSENQVSIEEPIVFDTVHYDVGGFHDPSQPTRLTIPMDGFYRVSALVTVLGAGYEGSSLATEVLVRIVRNGDPTDIVAGDSNTDEQPLGAQLIDAAGTGWFLAGDYVEVLITPNRTVESNWPGRGTVSPVLSIELLGR